MLKLESSLGICFRKGSAGDMPRNAGKKRCRKVRMPTNRINELLSRFLWFVEVAQQIHRETAICGIASVFYQADSPGEGNQYTGFGINHITARSAHSRQERHLRPKIHHNSTKMAVCTFGEHADLGDELTVFVLADQDCVVDRHIAVVIHVFLSPVGCPSPFRKLDGSFRF
jgi:hypothetical protein